VLEKWTNQCVSENKLPLGKRRLALICLNFNYGNKTDQTEEKHSWGLKGGVCLLKWMCLDFQFFSFKEEK